MRPGAERSPASLDRWIVAERPGKNPVDPWRAYAATVEEEHGADGTIQDVATVFLTNRECPFRCLMCDLWKNTTDETVPVGAIPTQIRRALATLPAADVIKLYNSGNFFDRNAIPPADYREIAELVSPFQTVIVESHPRLIGRRCFEFRRLVRGELQVAMGLETVHPEVLQRLNKRMTLDDFANAATALRTNDMSVRTFILLRPPYLTESEGVMWAKRSIDFAFDAGVECCAIIPTRGGNGAMETLVARGEFEAPTLDSLEDVLAYGLALRRGRVFVDLWDIEELIRGAANGTARAERLARMNLTQRAEPSVDLTSGMPKP